MMKVMKYSGMTWKRCGGSNEDRIMERSRDAAFGIFNMVCVYIVN